MRSLLTLVILYLFALTMLIGCAPATHRGQQAAEALSDKLSSVEIDINFSIPHADSIAQPRLRNAQQNVAGARADVIMLADAADANQARADKADKSLAAERTHWAGYKLRVAWHLVIGIAIGGSVLVVILYIFTPLAGPIAAGFHILTLGIFAVLKQLQNAVAKRVRK